MKHVMVMLAIVVTGLLFFGCSEENLTTPELNQSDQVLASLAKKTKTRRKNRDQKKLKSRQQKVRSRMRKEAATEGVAIGAACRARSFQGPGRPKGLSR